jgi:hypothetical protein
MTTPFRKMAGVGVPVGALIIAIFLAACTTPAQPQHAEAQQHSIALWQTFRYQPQPQKFALNPDLLALSQSFELTSLEIPGQTTPTSGGQSGSPAGANDQKQTSTSPATQDTKALNAQPKRILGVMPNFRAVSAGTTPPPPTAKQSFVIATKNSFDYSSFIFVGITSLMAEGSNTHPQLGKGALGFGRYYWRGFVDKTDGNYLVIFALPTILHEDERYYAMGKGGFWKRAFYSASRIAITPNYDGHNTLNISELLGRGIAQGISVAYYPSQSRTAGAVAQKYGYAIGRDALTNVFREFWPDIAVHILHRNP